MRPIISIQIPGYAAILALVAAFLLGGACEAAGMAFPGNDWVEKSPESQGVDSVKLSHALSWFERRCDSDGIREAVVVRNGYMIWKGDKIDRKHNTWSATKSFTSTVLGHLIDSGLCTLDTLAKDQVSVDMSDYATVTLRHLATMTSGYDAEGVGYAGDPDDGSK